MVWKSVWKLEKPWFFYILDFIIFTEYMCPILTNKQAPEKYKYATQYAESFFLCLQQYVLPTNSHLHDIVIFPLAWLLKVLGV